MQYMGSVFIKAASTVNYPWWKKWAPLAPPIIACVTPLSSPQDAALTSAMSSCWVDT
jgi:hypothetical protein